MWDIDTSRNCPRPWFSRVDFQPGLSANLYNCKADEIRHARPNPFASCLLIEAWYRSKKPCRRKMDIKLIKQTHSPWCPLGLPSTQICRPCLILTGASDTKKPLLLCSRVIGKFHLVLILSWDLVLELHIPSDVSSLCMSYTNKRCWDRDRKQSPWPRRRSRYD